MYIRIKEEDFYIIFSEFALRRLLLLLIYQVKRQSGPY